MRSIGNPRPASVTVSQRATLSPMSQPLISVVTPVYNGEEYLVQCIESILTQTYQRWEFVIVNNKSSDRSLDIAQAFARKDPRIRIFDNSEFLPPISNHNHALRMISPESKYCKVLHADDWLFPDCLARMVELAEANPCVGIVGAYRLDDVLVGLDGLPYPSTVIPGREICRASLLGGPQVFGSPTSLLLRANLVRTRTAFYDESIIWFDTDVCYRLLQDCDFGFVHQVLSFTRRHMKATSAYTWKLNTYITAQLHLLSNYGPTCLTKEEYERRLDEVTAAYYGFLAGSLLQPRGKDFWRYHRLQLAKLGYPLSISRLLAAACFRIARVVLLPLELLLRLAASWRMASR